MNKKSKQRLIFIICSAIFIIGCFIFYGCRLVKYYKIEHPEVDNKKDILLSERLIANKDITGTNNGLVEEKDGYYFKGKSENNYLLFSGIMYRIVSIDSNKNIKLVSDNNVTLLNYGSGELNASNIYEWLMNNYIETLDTKYLTNTKVCVDNIDDIKKIKCSKYIDDQLTGLLSMEDYKNAGLNNSYLNNNTYYYLSNTTSDNNIWYVYNKGGVNSDAGQNNYGIRPVITLKRDAKLISGDGSKNNPYIIEDNSVKTRFNEAKIGEYITYNNYKFRIIAKEEGKIKVAMEGYIKKEDSDVLIPFAEDDNIFSDEYRDSIGYYLNKTFYNTLENKDYIIKGDFYLGSIDIYDKANYKTIYNDKISTYIGLYQIGEMFINDYSDVFIMTTLSSSDDTIYTINTDHLLFETNITDSKKIRPVLYLDNTLNINSGNGTIANPYVLSR